MTRDSGKTIPGQESNEADKQQLKVARGEGEAYTNALEAMKKETGRGSSKKVRDYIVSLTEEEAEGMWAWQDNQLVWQNPTDENAHFEVVVRDAEDKRFVPYLDVTMNIAGNEGIPLVTEKLPFLWHPWLYHYGRNVKLPESGEYIIEVTISELKMSRHDKRNGNRFTKPVNVLFERFPVQTGQKLS